MNILFIFTESNKYPLKMKTLTYAQQIEKSYDYISGIFNKQGRVMPFNLCYGDGSIHGQLNMNEVEIIYTEILNYLKS